MWEVIVIIGFVFLVCARAIYFSGYVSDDYAALKKEMRKPRSKLWHIFHIVRGNKYWEDDGRLSMYITVGIHAINAVLVYIVFGQNIISFMGALMFGVNPYGSQCQIWRSGKVYSTALFSVLLMFLLPKLGGVFYGLALWCSAGASLSFIPYLLEYKWYYLLSIAPLGFLAIRHVSDEFHSHKYLFKTDVRKIRPRKLITMVKSYWYYFRMSLFPFHLGWDNTLFLNFGHKKQATEKAFKINVDFWLGILTLEVLSILIWKNWGTMISFGLIWWVTNMFMWTVAGTGRIVERYSYIALPGLMIAIASLLSKISPEVFFVGTCILIGIYSMKLYQYSLNYADAWWHLMHLIFEQRNCPSGWIRLGCDAIRMKDLQMGYLYLKQAERSIGGLDFVVAYNLANVTLAMGDVNMARVYFEAAKGMKDERTDADYSTQIEFFEKLLLEAQASLSQHGTYNITGLQLLTVN